MFEFIGILTVWLGGLAMCFYVPFVGALVASDRSKNLGLAFIGFWIACGLAVLYVGATVAYFVAT